MGGGGEFLGTVGIWLVGGDEFVVLLFVAEIRLHDGWV